jgi:hypothetical protein
MRPTQTAQAADRITKRLPAGRRDRPLSEVERPRVVLGHRVDAYGSRLLLPLQTEHAKLSVLPSGAQKAGGDSRAGPAARVAAVAISGVELDASVTYWPPFPRFARDVTQQGTHLGRSAVVCVSLSARPQTQLHGVG